MNNLIPDQIVGLTGINDPEILAIDNKLALDPDLIGINRDLRRKGDRFRHSAKRETTHHSVVSGPFCAVGRDLSRGKRCRRKFFNIEEITGLKMFCQPVGIGKYRVHLDLERHLALFGLAVYKIDIAGKILEPALVLTGDFRAGKFDLRIFRRNGDRLSIGLFSDRGRLRGACSCWILRLLLCCPPG